jgi:proteic killer suppression protein
MNVTGWKLHPLRGEAAGHWSVWVNGDWRRTFRFEGADATVVDYRDPHQARQAPGGAAGLNP